MRSLLLIPLLLLTSCAIKVEQAATKTTTTTTTKRSIPRKITWPDWTPSDFVTLAKGKERYFPNFVTLPSGEVATYGARRDGTESFAIVSKREINPKPGIYQFRLTYLPTSVFAGPSPLQPSVNTLLTPDRKWFFSAYNYRSTFFDLHPARTTKAKGLLVYHTSIMLLSIAEKQVIECFRKKGWNVLVALPPDSLYRTKLPAQISSDGTLQQGSRLLAEDMDRHYLEQAFTTKVALEYLSRTRPTWLTGKRVLMGTSAGTFGLPAEALMNPGWDALIFVSGGNNLLSLYESGSGGVFQESLDWLDEARQNPPPEVSRVFTHEEYHEIFRRASRMTRFHSGALAPHLQDQRVLMIAGSLDDIMPDDQSLGLYDALGSPERWTAPLGHHLIALQLILEVGRIDRWIMKE